MEENAMDENVTKQESDAGTFPADSVEADTAPAEKPKKWEKVWKILSYILVAALASFLTLLLSTGMKPYGKLDELRTLITNRYIGTVDQTKLDDGAAAGMLAAVGDRWSYYIPAAEFAEHVDYMKNEYVGIGVTIQNTEDEKGFQVLSVEPNGSAKEAGILPGDVIYAVDGETADTVGLDKLQEMVAGEEGTKVKLGVRRGDQTLTMEITRKRFQKVVASGELLPDGIGLVTIENFDERCAEETLAAVDSLIKQGAKALIFDVRYNPGGYKDELVKILDRLLPEGPLFRSVTYNGMEEVDESDASCLNVPMAVLMNEHSYSAAEFFAAALKEYDKAVLVGTATTGKSYFQNTYQLSDGSAVVLSVGKYCTPKGVSLAEVGGLKPDVEVPVTDEQQAAIINGTMEPGEDPQIQAAVAQLKK